MAQLNWTYYSLSGLPYILEMYHGEKSGHLIFFVNANIIIIDFNQKNDKIYNFFIENQMLEFAIKKENTDYSYEVIPQRLPKNEDQEKIFTKHFWIPLIIVIIVLNFILILLS